MLYAAAQIGAPRSRAEAGQSIALEDQAAAGRRLQADDGSSKRGLAAAALADNGQGLPAPEHQIYDVVDGVYEYLRPAPPVKISLMPPP